MQWVPDRDALLSHLEGMAAAGDVVLTLGAGDITDVGREFVRRRDGVVA